MHASFISNLFYQCNLKKKKKYKDLLEDDRRGSMIRSHVQDIEEGERPSKYFLSKDIFCNAKK